MESNLIDNEIITLLQELAIQEGEMFKICANPECKIPFITHERYKDDFCIVCSGHHKTMSAEYNRKWQRNYYRTVEKPKRQNGERG